MYDISQLRNLAEAELYLPATLHEYQWEGISFLYRSRSALLADEMGLGKTVQAAVALALLLNGQNEVSRALIVAPASLTTNWMIELSTWAPSLAVRHVQGSASDRGSILFTADPRSREFLRANSTRWPRSYPLGLLRSSLFLMRLSESKTGTLLRPWPVESCRENELGHFQQHLSKTTMMMLRQFSIFSTHPSGETFLKDIWSKNWSQ